MKDKYEESNSFGDHDLDREYQGREIAINLLYIANELAEANKLQKAWLKRQMNYKDEEESEGKD